jgi:hypothetical protein
METPTENPEVRKDFEAWGEVTDPKQHDPSKFRYLVHAINPMATTSMGMVGAMVMKDEPTSVDEAEGDQTINLYSNPEKLGDRVALSSSLIDQEHHGTWGDVGLIYETPPENVLITSPQDVGAMVMSKKRLEEQALKHTKLTPEELLRQTYNSSYNEVVVLAKKGDKKVRLKGFFYKATADGTPKNEALYQTFRNHARRLDLPLIPIEEPNPYAENKINRSEDRFSVQYGGKLYNLEGSPDWRFKSYGQSGYSVFASPDEMERVFGYLQDNNVPQEDIDRLRAEYQEADAIRQQSKVTYDEHGNITVVEKRSGYGADERRITVSKGGYARSVNVIEEAKKFSEMMADPTRPQRIEPFDRSIASLHEAEQVVREAIDLAPEDERQRLSEWWDLVKDNVQRQWENNQSSRGSMFETKFSSVDLSYFLKYFDDKKG